MTINEIFLKKEMSTQAFNTCLENNLESLMSLKLFYSKHGSFDSLINCNAKSKIELTGLCIKYFDFKSDLSVNISNYSNLDYYYLIRGFNQIQIDSLNRSILIVLKKLSIRSINAINRFFYGTIDAEGFSKHVFQNNFFEKHTLKKMNNVGAKSIPEILAFFNEIKNLIILISKSENKDDLSEFDINPNFVGFEYKVSQLNNEKRLIVNNFILSLNSKLSVRSYNSIYNFLENRFDITLITDKILKKDDFDFSFLKNVGRRSIPELEDYFNKIKEFTISILLDSNEYSEISQGNNLHVQTTISIVANNLFELIDISINECKLFNQTETFIFKHTHNLYVNNSSLTLNELSEILHKTSERIRQIREKLLNKFRNGITFLKQNSEALLSRYNLSSNEKYIIITDELCKEINTLDQSNFSKEFMTFILSVTLESEFTLIGSLETIKLKKIKESNFSHGWKNLYLVKNELFEIFDFTKFIYDVESKLNEKIKEDYKFNFRCYLSNFSFEKGSIISVELVSFCERLLKEEFPICLIINEDIIFVRNTIKPIHEYAREALEDIGAPAHKDLIEKRVKELYPDFEKIISNNNLKREYGFVPFGRSSVFGLKKWELENKTIKSGTIRSIVEEFLIDKSDPIHIKEISNYVLQYRPESNLKSILHNIKMEDNNRFLFFKNSYVGLKSLNYDLNFYELLDIPSLNKTIIDSPIKTNIENYNLLIEFISKNKRLPSSNKSDECQWYDFYQSQKKLYNNSMLNELYKMKFKKIVELIKI